MEANVSEEAGAGAGVVCGKKGSSRCVSLHFYDAARCNGRYDSDLCLLSQSGDCIVAAIVRTMLTTTIIPSLLNAALNNLAIGLVREA